jgi:hypothetical protein
VIALTLRQVVPFIATFYGAVFLFIVLAVIFVDKDN